MIYNAIQFRNFTPTVDTSHFKRGFIDRVAFCFLSVSEKKPRCLSSKTLANVFGNCFTDNKRETNYFHFRSDRRTESPPLTERGSLTAGQQPGELSLASFPSGSAAINTVWVGGGLDLVSVFLLCSGRQKNSLARRWRGEWSTQTTAHCTTCTLCYFLHAALTPITRFFFNWVNGVCSLLRHLTHLTREARAVCNYRERLIG